MESKKDTRARNFATIVYPESAPENWQDILADELIPAFISPLHDSDINPTGEAKKPHYHVLLMFEGKKSVSQVDEIIGKFNGVGHEKVNSLRGYARYLCHLDNPEKFQYDTASVRSLAGADYVSAIGLPTDRYKAIKDMMHYCMENHISSYSDLLLYASEERFDWFRVLCDNGTYVIKEFLKSESWKINKPN